TRTSFRSFEERHCRLEALSGTNTRLCLVTSTEFGSGSRHRAILDPEAEAALVYGRIQFVPNGHVLDAADEARAQPRDRSGQFGVFQPLAKFAEDDLQL